MQNNYVDYKTQRKMETLSVSFIKPERRIQDGKETVEVNITTTSEVNTSSKKRTNSSRRK